MGTDDEAAERLAAVLASDVPVLVDADGLTLVAARKELLARDAPTLLTPHAGELGRLLGADPADVESRRLEHARKAAASLGATVLLKGSTTVIAAPDGHSAAYQGGAGAGGREAARAEAGRAEAGRAEAGRAEAGRAEAGEAGRGTASQSGGGQDEQPVWVNLTGTSWLATAGTGDVLSGLGLAAGAGPGDGRGRGGRRVPARARRAAGGRGAGSRPVPAVEPSGDGWDLSNPEESRAGYPEAPIGAADVVGALPDADQVGPPPDRVARPSGQPRLPAPPGLAAPARACLGQPTTQAAGRRIFAPDQPSADTLANWEAIDGHAEALIDLDTVARNIEAMRQHVGGVPLMAVVKADGYGHGMIPAAHAAVAGGAQWLGVVHEHEALALRRAGLTARVLCLLGAPGAAHESAIRDDVDLTVDAVPLLQEIVAAAARAGRPARVQLKIDTGMARGEPRPADWPALVAAARSAEAAGDITITGIWSHLACADIPGHPSVDAQLARFTEAVALAEAAGDRPEVRHLADTAATLDFPGHLASTRCGRVARSTAGHDPRGRAGLAPPGHDTADAADPGQAGPRGDPRVLRSPLHHPGREHPGADPARLCRGNTPACLRRGRGARPPASAGASPAPSCMDLSVIDFGGGKAETGDEVVLFGPGDSGEQTAQQWADALDTVSYEIVTNFAGGVPRTYRGVAYENRESPGAGLSGAVTGPQT